MATKRILAVTMVSAVLAIIFIYLYFTQPDIRKADGAYFNSCCGTVYVRGNEMQTRLAVVPIHQVVMKFGLTVYLKQDPLLFHGYGKRLNEDELPSLQFNSVDDPQYFDVSDVGAKVYRFRRLPANR